MFETPASNQSKQFNKTQNKKIREGFELVAI